MNWFLDLRWHRAYTTTFLVLLISHLVACGGNDSESGNTATETIPSSPQNIVTISEDGSVSLSWNTVTGAISYNIYWNSTGSVTNADTKIADVDTPYTHTDLSNDTTYYYIVTAVNSAGESAPSDEISMTPEPILSPMQNVQAIGTDSQVTLSWEPIDNAVSYNIYWNTTGTVTEADNVIANTTSSYKHLDLTNAKKYYYLITAVDSLGEIIASNRVTAIPNIKQIYYVSTSVDGNGDCTSSGTVMSSLGAAMAAAAAPAEIRIHTGSFGVDSSVGSRTTIVLKENVSLYGGYSLDYCERDPAVYKTSITDLNRLSGSGTGIAIDAGQGISAATIIDGFELTGSSSSRDNPTASSVVIRIREGAAPTIQNNIINGGNTGGATIGISISSSSPTVQNNIINGGEGFIESTSYGMRISGDASPLVSDNIINGGSSDDTSVGISSGSNSAPIIRNNFINGGKGGSRSTTGVITIGGSPIIENNIVSGSVFSGSSSTGLQIIASSANVYNNIFIGGGSMSSGTAYGIYISGADSQQNIFVRNNIIYSGSGADKSYGVYTGFVSSLILDNNIIVADIFGRDTYCVYEGLDGTPNSVRNNAFFSCNTMYWDDDGGCVGDDANPNTCTLLEMEALTDFALLSASNNISEDPLLVNLFRSILGTDALVLKSIDWHFTPSSPISVTQGGLNGEGEGGWGYATDKDGVTRPSSGSNWSIGPYEP